MRRLDGYLANHIIRGYLLVLLVLVSMFGLIQFQGELSDIGDGSYEWTDALLYVLLRSPGLAVELVPVVALLGTLVGLGRLAAGSELVVVRTAGVSHLRIAWSALRPGILLVAIALLLAEFAVPPLDRLAEAKRSHALAGTIELPTEHGFWFRDGNRFLNVGELQHGRIPVDIDIYRFDGDGRLTRFTHARRADIVGQGQWLLTDVVQKDISEAGVATRRLGELPWRSFLTQSKLSTLIIGPESLAISDLYQNVRDVARRGQSADALELALWQKLSIALAAWGLILLAVPLVLGPLRSSSAGARLSIGAVLGIGFYFGNQLVAHAALLWGFAPIVGATAPDVVLLAAAFALLRRTP
ncbi:MAG: LPS export ABC transporter permease LptG [Gammaproteobacteria bacterium]|nr:LPS export ABC transporter permease LptG [Gammaproteobacteria bacterium]NIR81929.1 LPS export ABC transporter permease LptG [Gammaproteobacteria bacterium]NIR88761.1 LPS export ABC transporter permease LptG [Gammaproteobacteria bacterium]NIU03037.1 LPS export ABC transporter permease LptG [Gammaproteobacteria bacterium]NIV50558.1 LPS export ABC transporter permease LptG [Gammaproteobacteria bacterium]